MMTIAAGQPKGRGERITAMNPDLTELKYGRAIQALISICEIGSDKKLDWPERVGKMEMTAAITLSSLDHPEWEEKLLAELMALTQGLLTPRGDCGDKKRWPENTCSPQGGQV